MRHGEHDHAADAFAYAMMGLKKPRKRRFMDRVVSPVCACLIIILITLTLYEAGSYMADGIQSATMAIF